MTEQQHPLQDINIRSTASLTSPAELKQEVCLSGEGAEAVYQAREAAKAILRGKDRRVIAVVGPCSIHDRDAAIEYAEKLAPLAAKSERSHPRRHACLFRETANDGRLEGPYQRPAS